jgi:hypothetical protein
MIQYYKDDNYVYIYGENTTIAFNENEIVLWEQYQKWILEGNEVIELPKTKMVEEV